MKPVYADASDVPSLSAASLARARTTHTRHKQLLRAARRPHDAPPPRPGADECCGSSCKPCVVDLWREEVDVWRERWWGDKKGGPDLSAMATAAAAAATCDIAVEGEENKDKHDKMPGAFSLEW